jgi:hypothetical protein
MIESYPTSNRKLGKYKELIFLAVSHKLRYELTTNEMNQLSDQLTNHSNDYYVKSFYKQFTFEQAALVTPEEVINFAVRVSKSVAS